MAVFSTSMLTEPSWSSSFFRLRPAGDDALGISQWRNSRRLFARRASWLPGLRRIVQGRLVKIIAIRVSASANKPPPLNALRCWPLPQTDRRDPSPAERHKGFNINRRRLQRGGRTGIITYYRLARLTNSHSMEHYGMSGGERAG